MHSQAYPTRVIHEHLPYEVITNIFLHACNNDGQRAVLRLMKVCSIWKAICEGTPALFSRVELNYRSSHFEGDLHLPEDFQKAQEWVSRSGILHCQLELSLDFRGAHNMAIPGIYLGCAPLISPFLVTVGHRLTRLALGTPVEEFIAFMLAIESVTFPLLEQLEIHLHDIDEYSVKQYPGISLASKANTRLRSASIDIQSAGILPHLKKFFNWSILEKLRFRHEEGTRADFVDILNSCQSLEFLDIDTTVWDSEVGLDEPLTTPIKLPHLKKFMASIDVWSEGICRVLRFPTINTLVLDGADPNDKTDIASALLEAHRVVSMPLRTLVIRYCNLDLSDTINLLKELPRLTCLELEGTKITGHNLFERLTHSSSADPTAASSSLLPRLTHLLIRDSEMREDEGTVPLKTILDMLESRLYPQSNGGSSCDQLSWFEIDDPRPSPYQKEEELAGWLGKLASGILGRVRGEAVNGYIHAECYECRSQAESDYAFVFERHV